MNTVLGGPAGYGENVFSSTSKVGSGNNDEGSVEIDVTSVFGDGIDFSARPTLRFTSARTD